MNPRVALAAAVLLLGGAGSGAAEPMLRLHYPPDGLVVSGQGHLSVLAEVDRAAAGGVEVEVRLAGGQGDRATPRARADGPTVFHGAVRLRPGVNQVEVVLGVRGRPPAVTTRRVYFLSPLANETVPPPGYARAPFHRGPPASCGGCHELAARADDAGPATPAASTCRSCHARLTAAAEVHGPAAQWACTRCHDPSAAPARYATPDPPMPLCFSCHAEQKERFYGSRYQHGPTATGRCTLCHDPHGSPNQFFLRKATWDLCTTCHAEKGSGRHVISWGPTGQTHPTRGRPDPSRPGREVSCASCHNPHAAPGPKLWNFGAVLYLELCRNCHRTILGG